ncbi:hypothetical protein ACJX0J_042150, partial [Zea mays]
MALVSPAPAPSAPNAPSPPQHQHASVPIPGPAANSQAAVDATLSSPGASASTPSLSPPVSHATKGRSKSVRWGDLSPASSDGATSLDSRPSFKDVLVRTVNPSPLGRVAAQGSAPAAGKPSALGKVNRQPHLLSTKRWSPRQATHPTPAIRLAPGFTDQVWTTVESKKGRSRRLKASWLPGRVPADLVGRCFNCLGCDHRAAGCGSEPRCFLCSALGHKSSSCPKAPVWRRLGRPRPVKLVWERFSPAIEGRVQRPAGLRSVWQRIAPPEAISIVPSVLVGNMLASRLHRVMVALPAPGANDGGKRNMSIAEDNLKTAAVITVVSSRDVSADEIVLVLAPRLEMEEGGLVHRQFSQSSFLAVLPNQVQLDTLVDRFHIIREENFMLSSRRWTRFGGVVGNSLKHLVELELRGLLVHAWETSVVQHLINPHACISQVLPDTLEIRSLEVFRCLAWCCDPERIPSKKDLWITEPDHASAAEGKKALVYPVQIHWVPADLSLIPSAPQPPDGGGDQDKPDTPPSRRRCGDNSPPTQHAAIFEDPGKKTHTHRRPVHDRLGPLRRSDSPRELSQPWVLVDIEARSSQPCDLLNAVVCSRVGNPPAPVPDGVHCLAAGDVLLRREGGCDEVIPMTPLAASSICPSSRGRRRLMMKTATKQAKFRNPPIAFFRWRQRAPKTPEGAAPPPCSSGDRGAGSSLGALPPAPTAGVAASPFHMGRPRMSCPKGHQDSRIFFVVFLKLLAPFFHFRRQLLEADDE